MKLKELFFIYYNVIILRSNLILVARLKRKKRELKYFLFNL